MFLPKSMVFYSNTTLVSINLKFAKCFSGRLSNSNTTLVSINLTVTFCLRFSIIIQIQLLFLLIIALLNIEGGRAEFKYNSCFY